jgi:hypothetical protein
MFQQHGFDEFFDEVLFVGVEVLGGVEGEGEGEGEGEVV